MVRLDALESAQRAASPTPDRPPRTKRQRTDKLPSAADLYVDKLPGLREYSHRREEKDSLMLDATARSSRRPPAALCRQHSRSEFKSDCSCRERQRRAPVFPARAQQAHPETRAARPLAQWRARVQQL